MNTITLLSIVAMLGAGDAQPVQRTLEVAGVERSYLVYFPVDQAKPERGWPVVLVFHGGGGNGEQVMRHTNMNATAQANGYIAVYPNGSGRLGNLLTWNAGNCCGYAERNHVDDVTFVNALLDELEKEYDVDADRVYATGMSNGAMMCHRLASELSDRIAAIAPVAGTFNVDDFHPSRPVPVMMFHGTGDHHVNYAGGVGSESLVGVSFTSVADTCALWVKHNGCGEPVEAALPDTSDDGMTVTRTTWLDPQRHADVVLYTIHGGGHAWPGRAPWRPGADASTRDVDANALMWDFFAAHPRRGEPDAP